MVLKVEVHVHLIKALRVAGSSATSGWCSAEPDLAVAIVTSVISSRLMSIEVWYFKWLLLCRALESAMRSDKSVFESRNKLSSKTASLSGKETVKDVGSFSFS